MIDFILFYFFGEGFGLRRCWFCSYHCKAKLAKTSPQRLKASMWHCPANRKRERERGLYLSGLNFQIFQFIEGCAQYIYWGKRNDVILAGTQRKVIFLPVPRNVLFGQQMILSHTKISSKITTHYINSIQSQHSIHFLSWTEIPYYVWSCQGGFAKDIGTLYTPHSVCLGQLSMTTHNL